MNKTEEETSQTKRRRLPDHTDALAVERRAFTDVIPKQGRPNNGRRRF